MAKRVSSDEALIMMRNGGLEPLAPFKNNSTPWPSKCLVCDMESSPTLKSIRNRNSNRRGCRHCAPNAKKSDEQAIEVMRNASLEPLEPYVNSTTKWKCKCLGCESIVFPTYGSIKGGQGGCLKCAGMLVNPDEAKLLFKQNDLEPLVSYPGARKPWKSRHTVCGREVEPTYSNVRNGHSGCKYCVGNIVDEDKARRIFIASGLLPLEPYRNALSSWKSIHQECGNIVSPKYNTVQQGSSGCQFCAGNLPVTEQKAIQLLISKDLEPLEPFPGTNVRWKSKHTKCGKIVFPRYSSIQQGQSGCGFCARTKLDTDEAIQFFKERGLIPLENYVNSGTPWRSIHVKCGREVAPAYNSVQQGSSGCGYCAGNIVDAEEAKKLFISRGLIPQESFPGANKPWRSIHAQCGGEVFIKYAYVLDGSSGCRECAANYVNPELALEIFRTANLEPLEPYPGAHRGWRAIHTVCGREVAPNWGYVRKFLAGCKYCAGKALTNFDAEAILEAKGFKPLEPYPGSQKPWKMIHLKCGLEVSPRLNSLQYAAGGGEGCRKCADSTFNYSEPAIIYLMTHSNLFAHKVGISGEKKNRVQQHRREGWETFKTLKFETGERAYEVEQEVLSWLSESYGWTPYLTKSEMPQGGYTETIDASEIDLVTIWSKVEELSKSNKEI
jgi:hypothetical protein